MLNAGDKAGVWRAVHLISLVVAVFLWFGCGLNLFQGLAACRLPYWQRFYVAAGSDSQLAAFVDDGDDAAVAAYKENCVIMSASAHWNKTDVSLPFHVYTNRQLVLDGYLESRLDSKALNTDSVFNAFKVLRANDTTGACSSWTQFDPTRATINDAQFRIPLTGTRHDFSAVGLLGCTALWGLPLLAVTSRQRFVHWRGVAAGSNSQVCPKCNYDMHGVQSATCPECGAVHPGRSFEKSVAT